MLRHSISVDSKGRQTLTLLPDDLLIEIASDVDNEEATWLSDTILKVFHNFGSTNYNVEVIQESGFVSILPINKDDAEEHDYVLIDFTEIGKSNVTEKRTGKRKATSLFYSRASSIRRYCRSICPGYHG